MTKNEMYEMLKYTFKTHAEDRKFLSKEVVVAEEGFSGDKGAINGFEELPALNGKEVMIIGEHKEAKGECSTSAPARFKGTVEQVLELDLDNAHQRSVFIAAMNAVMNKYMLADDCVRCKSEDADECALDALRHFKKNNGKVNILIVGYQPYFVNRLAGEFPLRVLDLDPEIIGKNVSGITIENGADVHKDAVDWSDVILCTGSVFSNGTMMDYLNITKDIRFYGTTAAGIARVLSLTRFCPYSRN